MGKDFPIHSVYVFFGILAILSLSNEIHNSPFPCDSSCPTVHDEIAFRAKAFLRLNFVRLLQLFILAQMKDKSGFRST